MTGERRSRTVRELIRVLERAANHSADGDLSEVLVETPDGRFAVPGVGETATGALYDPDLRAVVIETEAF